MRNRPVRFQTLAALSCSVMLSSAAVICAAEVDNEDSAPRSENRTDNRPAMGARPGWWRGDRMGAPTTRQLTPEEVAEIETFMQKHSPKRFERFLGLPERRREGLLFFLAVRYRQLQEMKQNDPDVFALRMARMTIEDEVFDLGWRLNHDSPADKSELEARLRQQVRLLMQSTIDEKKLRVKQWQARVEEETASIAKDEADLDRIVDANVTALLNSDKFPGMMNLLGPGMGRGMRQDRPRDQQGPGPGPFAAPAPPTTRPAAK